MEKTIVQAEIIRAVTDTPHGYPHRMALLLSEGHIMTICIPQGTDGDERKLTYDKWFSSYFEIALFTILADGIDKGTISPVPLAYRNVKGIDDPYDALSHWPAFLLLSPTSSVALHEWQDKAAMFLIEEGQAISDHVTQYEF